MTITNENIFQADYEVAETWRGHNGANDQGNHPATKVIIPKQFIDDVKALCDYSGYTELTPGMTIRMSLREALSIMPRRRKRLDSFQSLIRFLHDEMAVTLIINSQKTNRNEK